MRSHRDLGVIIDVNLKFHSHIRSIVNHAAGLASNLLKSTICRSAKFMVTLFIAHIRPLIDYCSPLWNLEYLTDTRMLESVQRRWTKKVVGLSDLNYHSRLRVLGLFSIQGRLLRADLIKIWKAFHPSVDVGLSAVFELSRSNITRGHEYKLMMPISRTEVKRRFLNARRVTLWNSLSSRVVEASTLEQFKARLEEENSDMLYHYQ